MPSNPQNKGNIHLNSGQIHCFSKIHSKNNTLPNGVIMLKANRTAKIYTLSYTQKSKSLFCLLYQFLIIHRTGLKILLGISGGIGVLAAVRQRGRQGGYNHVGERQAPYRFPDQATLNADFGPIQAR
ncbi:hypothetical protein [Acidocella sp.]|uniref:hypothetical protein n=1 Tax=Acidocella sp. TaxID=50710 RepID=UPI00260F621B|nr:hypothetical protein [Acidocella sp.]